MTGDAWANHVIGSNQPMLVREQSSTYVRQPRHRSMSVCSRKLGTFSVKMTHGVPFCGRGSVVRAIPPHGGTDWTNEAESVFDWSECFKGVAVLKRASLGLAPLCGHHRNYVKWRRIVFVIPEVRWFFGVGYRKLIS